MVTELVHVAAMEAGSQSNVFSTTFQLWVLSKPARTYLSSLHLFSGNTTCCQGVSELKICLVSGMQSVLNKSFEKLASQVDHPMTWSGRGPARNPPVHKAAGEDSRMVLGGCVLA